MMPCVIGKCFVRFWTAISGSPLVLGLSTSVVDGAEVSLTRPLLSESLAQPRAGAFPRWSNDKPRDGRPRDPRAQDVPCRKDRTGADTVGGTDIPAGPGLERE